MVLLLEPGLVGDAVRAVRLGAGFGGHGATTAPWQQGAAAAGGGPRASRGRHAAGSHRPMMGHCAGEAADQRKAGGPSAMAGGT